MAYAAVMSLMYTIKGLLDSPRISVASSTRQTLRSADYKARSLQSTLEECSEGVRDIDERIIIEAARKLEDAIELHLSQSPTFSFNHDHDADCFVKTVKERERIIKRLWEQKAAKMIEEDIQELFVQKPSISDQEDEEDVDMVGLSDLFLQIRDYLLAKTGRVIWISGMAGIGKTALAKKIFDDPLVKKNFQCRAFVRLGLKCRPKERILQAITDQVNLDNQRKPLIVLDDVWEERLILHALEETGVRKEKGCRILVTSRRAAILSYSWNFKMRFMNEEESWELLRRKVFGEEEEECPSQLVKAGKKIAEKCEGLPLLINAVAPILLSEAQKNPECWNRVANKPDSVLEAASHQISEVLLKSYNQINEDQKLYFLYIAVFPRSFIVRLSTIINLWCAEGFKDSNVYKQLIKENLVMGRQKSCSSGYKACSLHCAYWYVSKRVAEDNKFLYTINSYADGLDDRVNSHRRLAIYQNVLFAIKEVHDSMASVSTVRSLLCTGPYHQYQVPICWEWKLLRVLDALTIRYYEFPLEVVKLIRLRYLALTCNANLPRSISTLRDLEFLIVRQHLSIKRVADESYVPLELWDLQELKHLEIMGRNLPDPRPGAILPNLRRLLDVGVESCTKGVLESIPKLEKLRIQIELAADAAETLSCLDHISCLNELKSFQSVIKNPTLLSPPPPLSISTSSLQKLSLSGFGYPWEDMSKIGELRHLQVLKLQCYAFRGEKWEAKEKGFPRLEYLLIEDTDLVQWTVEYGTLLWVKRLTMKNCHKLQEIPLIPSVMWLDNIELVDCNPLAETCAKKRYDAKNVAANYSWKEEKLKS